MRIIWRSLLRYHEEESTPDCVGGSNGHCNGDFRQERGSRSFDSHFCLKHSSDIDQL